LKGSCGKHKQTLKWYDNSVFSLLPYCSQDRNSGLSQNSLLIRTTCLRTVSFDLSPENKFEHPDGIVTLGAGMTWGTSKLNMKGMSQRNLFLDWATIWG
jgi:hypothetical protein